MKNNGLLIVTKKVNVLNEFNGLNGRVPNYDNKYYAQSGWEQKKKKVNQENYI